MLDLFGGRKKARQNAIAKIAMCMQAQLGGYARYLPSFIDIIKSDPYVAGYIQGKLATLIAYSIKFEKLHLDDEREVGGFVLMYLFGKDRTGDASSALGTHLRSRSNDYLIAREKGTVAAHYALTGECDGKKAIDDPDYRKAWALVSDYKIDTTQTAMIGFDLLWFTEHMKQYCDGDELIHLCGSSCQGLGTER